MISVFRDDPVGASIYSAEYKYSWDGYRTVVVTYPKNDILSETTYYFNGPGQGSATIERRKSKEPGGKPTNIQGLDLDHLFVYDSSKRLISLTAVEAKTKKPHHRITISYNGSWVERKYFDAGDALVQTTSVSLNEKGDPLTERTIFADRSRAPESISYAYPKYYEDEAGNWRLRDVFRKNAEGKLEKLYREMRSLMYWELED
jgi:hypothetical protein